MIELPNVLVPVQRAILPAVPLPVICPWASIKVKHNTNSVTALVMFMGVSFWERCLLKHKCIEVRRDDPKLLDEAVTRNHMLEGMRGQSQQKRGCYSGMSVKGASKADTKEFSTPASPDNRTH